MKKYQGVIGGILLTLLGVLLLGGFISIFIIFNTQIRTAIPNDTSYIFVILISCVVSLLFLIGGIYVTYKEIQTSKRLDALDALGIRKLGIVKNVRTHPKDKTLIQFDLEVIISKKGSKHIFISDWIAYRNFPIENGVYLYVIYAKDNLSKYAIVYDKIIRK
jgi:hypothetical protein